MRVQTLTYAFELARMNRHTVVLAIFSAIHFAVSTICRPALLGGLISHASLARLKYLNLRTQSPQRGEWVIGV
jgi:hypothetical protein